MSLQPQTPSQTIGPFFHDGLLRIGVDDIDHARTAGRPIVVTGNVLDGAGDIVDDAMIEVWQSDGDGRYEHPADGRRSDVPRDFIGFGRLAPAAGGGFRFATAMPGTVPGRHGDIQAPHLNIQVFARGLLDRLCTRIYFEGHDANDTDPILRSVPASRRATLIARRSEATDQDQVIGFRFDLVLQGEHETVFFDI